MIHHQTSSIPDLDKYKYEKVLFESFPTPLWQEEPYIRQPQSPICLGDTNQSWPTQILPQRNTNIQYESNLIYFESKKQFYAARIMGKIDRITILKWDNKSEARKKATLLFCIFQSYGILIWKQNCDFFWRKSLCLHFVLRAGGEKRNFLSDTMDGHRHHFHHDGFWGGPVCGNEKNYRIRWIEIYKW